MARTAALAMTLFLTTCTALADPAPGPPPEFDWPAMPEIGGPDLVNPAGYAELYGTELSVSFFTSDSAFEKVDRVSLTTPGAGLSGWWLDDASMRRFSTGAAITCMRDRLSLGTSWTWFDPTVSGSPWSDKGYFSFGLLLRPSGHLSLGVAHDLGTSVAGSTCGRRFSAGLGVRPFGSEMLTVLVNARAEDIWEDEAYSAGVELRPMQGLALRADVEDDASFSAGLGIDLGRMGLSFAGRGSDDDAFTGSRGSIILGSRPRGSIMGSPGGYVRVSPGTAREEASGGLLASPVPSFSEFSMMLRRAVEDDSVEGFVLDVRRGAGNAAQAEELRSLLEMARQRGKRVFAYLQSAGNMPYYLASVAEEIYMHPSSEVAITGMGGSGFFARGLLDRVGIYPDLLHIGEYKSASDMLTRYDMSEAQREAMTALLESNQETLESAIGNGRGLSRTEVREMMGRAVFTASRALDAGLVDGMAYHDELEERLEESLGRSPRIVPLESYAAEITEARPWGPDPHVAVIVATGTITTGESGSSPLIGRTMGSETVCGLLEHASREPGAVALVLRIDSGGGDALASDDMLHALYRAAERLPVVVSMGHVAGSGGYYMACGADRIFADEMTITGSIGVITGKFVIADLVRDLGIGFETVDVSPRAGMGSMLRRYDELELEIMRESIEDSYRDFVAAVAQGRGLSGQSVDSIGRGRIWSGPDALEIGLVDEIGGVTDAIVEAWRMAGMPPGELPAIEVYPKPGLLSGLQPSLGLLQSLSAADPLLPWPPGAVLYLMAPVGLSE
ncbi:signal peptide peptidase SppA [Candidatus Fermentibacterales bacterium]|nr:signal peptide peptidase SppA [Candidatus Fermentibacterales bacterium]